MEQETKPAVQSVGVMANGIGSIFGSVLGILALMGQVVPEPITISILAVAATASNLLGLWGRVKAKEKIDGIFFQK